MMNAIQLLGVLHLFDIVVLHGEFGVSLEVVPQSAHQLAHYYIIGVLLDNSQQENAVLSQILVQKRVQNLEIHNGRGRSGRRRMVIIDEAAQAIVDLQVALDKRHPRRATKRAQPVDECVRTQRRYQTKPEPDKDEDLLVEQINGQRALNGVLLVVLAQSSDREVAHGDARKARRLPEVLAIDEIADDVEAVQVKFGSHEHVEQKKLSAHVHHVEQLDEHVE